MSSSVTTIYACTFLVIYVGNSSHSDFFSSFFVQLTLYIFKVPSLKSKRQLSFLCAGGRVSHSLTSPPKSKEACLWDNNVLVRHTKHAVFYTAVDFVCTGVCQIKIWVSRHQLVSRTRSHTVAVCQISAAVTQQLRRKPNSDIPECIYALTWRSLISHLHFISGRKNTRPNWPLSQTHLDSE